MISSVEAIRRSNYFMIIKISSTVKELQEDCHEAVTSITSYKSKFTFFLKFGLVPLAGRIFRGLENTTG